MRRKRLVTLLGSICLILVLAALPFMAACPAPAEEEPTLPEEPEVIVWRFSNWGAPRAKTMAVEWWGREMAKRTEGRFRVEFYYGAVLSPSTEQLEGIKAGLFEIGTVDQAYGPDKLPLLGVAAIPCSLPLDTSQIGKLQVALYEHPALVEELESRWDAVYMFPAVLPQYALMGNKPIRTVEDFEGQTIRASGIQADYFSSLGAIPRMVPAPELYEAVDKGIINQAWFPWAYCFGAYRVHEVAKYCTYDLGVGNLAEIVCASKEAWDALPEDIKRIHEALIPEVIDRFAFEYAKADEKWIPIYKDAGVELICCSPEMRADLVKAAVPFQERWVKDMEAKGLPGREVLNYYLDQRKRITGK